MADTPAGETVPPGDSQTPVTTPAAPVANASDPAEVDRLRKEKEQADLRIRQLENEKVARDKADEEARQKQLEEKEEWKTVAEEAKSKLDAIEAEKATAERNAELKAESAKVLDEFAPEVKKVAETAGMSLADNTAEAIAEFKTKLTALAETVKAPTPAGNNPPPRGDDASLPSAEVLTAIKYGNKDARKAYIQQSPSIQAVKKELQRQAGADFS